MATDAIEEYSVFVERWGTYRWLRALVWGLVVISGIVRLVAVGATLASVGHALLVADMATSVVSAAGAIFLFRMSIERGAPTPRKRRIWRFVVLGAWLLGIGASMVLVLLECHFIGDEDAVRDLYTCGTSRVGLVSGFQLTTVTGWMLLCALTFHISLTDTAVSTALVYVALLIAMQATDVDLANTENLRFLGAHLCIVVGLLFHQRHHDVHSQRTLLDRKVVRGG